MSKRHHTRGATTSNWKPTMSPSPSASTKLSFNGPFLGFLEIKRKQVQSPPLFLCLPRHTTSVPPDASSVGRGNCNV